jgi:hypothetical protein
MLDGFITNPTELTGLLSFAAATIACLIAARRSGSRDARTWKVLALMNCLFLMEIYFGLRYPITQLARTLLETDGLYAQLHGSIQEIIVISIIALGCLSLFLLWRQVAGGAARIAASITVAVLFLFAIETVSLHSVDAVFYRPIGPVLMLGWVWGIAAAGICLAATQSSHSKVPEMADKYRWQSRSRDV